MFTVFSDYKNNKLSWLIVIAILHFYIIYKQRFSVVSSVYHPIYNVSNTDHRVLYEFVRYTAELMNVVALTVSQGLLP